MFEFGLIGKVDKILVFYPKNKNNVAEFIETELFPRIPKNDHLKSLFHEK